MESSDHQNASSCECDKFILSVQDAMYVLNGKWRLPIMVALRMGHKRFKDISLQLDGITDKMLSKELKELELNQLVTRTVHEDFAYRVEYAITDHGLSLEEVLMSLRKWGDKHRKKIFEL